MRESIAVGTSQEVSALKKRRRDVEMLCRSWSRRRRRARVETRRAHAAQVIVVADRFLLTSNLHFFVLFVPMLPVDLLELHRDLAQFLQCLPRQHHLLAVAHVAVEELLHHVHVVDDERVKTLQVARRIQLSHEIDFEWRVVNCFAAARVLIRLIAAGK